MNQEQREFISAVILPKLVAMAIDETLPMDMNEMCYSHFEDEAEAYNKGREHDLIIRKLGEFLSYDTYEELEGMYKILLNHPDPNEITGWIDGVRMCQRYETSFMVKELLEEIKP